MVLDIELGALNLHPLHATRDRRRAIRFFSRLLQLGRRFLDRRQWAFRLASLRVDGIAQLLRRQRQRPDQTAGIVTQRISGGSDARDNAQHQNRRAQGARNPATGHPVHHRRQAVAEKNADHQGDENGLAQRSMNTLASVASSASETLRTSTGICSCMRGDSAGDLTPGGKSASAPRGPANVSSLAIAIQLLPFDDFIAD